MQQAFLPVVSLHEGINNIWHTVTLSAFNLWKKLCKKEILEIGTKVKSAITLVINRTEIIFCIAAVTHDSKDYVEKGFMSGWK